MPALQRRLGTTHAVFVGLAAMIGAGVFFVWSPAAEVAGPLLLVSLLIAAIVATLNALSSAQLAMAYPVSGGAYAFGRATIGPGTGFAAGWLFLLGKTSSAAAIATIAGAYLWPGVDKPLAVAVVAALALVNVSGIRSTAAVSAAIVSIVLAAIAVVLVLALVSPPAAPASVSTLSTTPYGVLQGAGLLFFAFAGYARMATLSEEVREPRRTLPRAIVVALAITLTVYATVGAVCLTLLGPDLLATTESPLAELVGGGADAVLRLVAGLACLGSLLGVLAGLSRTSLAMARERDLPGALSRVSERTSSPVVAEVTVAVLAMLGILLLDATALVAFSSACVLGYYAIANASAVRQTEGRWLPRWLSALGFAGCLVLAVTLPWPAIVGAVVALGIGLGGRTILRRIPAKG